MTRRLKRMYVVIGTMVLLLIGLIFWLLQDETLSSDATQLLSDVRVYDAKLQHDPYFLWLGFEAKSDAEQAVLGRKRYHQDWYDFYHSNDPNLDAQRDRFTALKGQFFSESDQKILSQLKEDLAEGVSLVAYEKYTTELTRMYAEQSLLNARWQRLLDQPVVNTPPLFLSPEGAMPDYVLMMNIHRLYVAQLIFQQDVNGLARYTERLIQQDQKPSSLLDKMVMLAVISQNIDLIHALNQRLNTHQTLSGLSLSQMSMRFPYASETAMVQAIVSRLYHRQGQNGLFDVVVQADHDQKNLVKHGLADMFTPLVLQKNMSINRYVRHIVPTLKISQLPDPAFKQALQQPYQFEGHGFSIKNYMGNVLMDMALPQWETYAIRPRLVNQKIRLLNLLARHEAIDIRKLNQNAEGDVFYQTKNLLCIKTPNPFMNEEEERKYGSCLNIAK